MILFFCIVFAVLLYYIIKNRNFLKFLFSIFKEINRQKKEKIQKKFGKTKKAIFVAKENRNTLSKEEKFALALGDLEYERLLKYLENRDMQNYLEDEWGLSFEDKKSKNHTLYTLQKIRKEGTVPLLFRNLHLEKEVSVSDMIAFDSSRFSELLRQAIYLNFIEEEEAWGLLFLNAQRLQDSYKSFSEYKEAYFRGSTLYQYAQLKEEEQKSFDFQKELMLKQENSEVEIVWLKEAIFSQFKREENS